MFIGFPRSEEIMTGIWVPMTMLNVWRIPFLFFVSGMGVYFAIRKRNWKELLIERTKRILLPFIFGFFAITPIHFFIFQKYYGMAPAYYPHAGHLWFLFNIFCYVLLLSPLFFYLKRNGNGKFKRTLSMLMKNPLGPLSICLFFIAEVLIVNPSIFEMYAETLHGFILGFLAFLFGFLFVFTGNTFWETMQKWRWAYLGLAVLLYAVRILVFNSSAPLTLVSIESNIWIFSLFGFGYRYLNQPSRALSYLSQAAYPVYIIHMLVLYTGAVIILPLQLPVEVQFVLIVLFTGIGCYLIYEFIIRRINFLSPLFGLKWNSDKHKGAAKINPSTFNPVPSRTPKS
jgi:hypothetical protein